MQANKILISVVSLLLGFSGKFVVCTSKIRAFPNNFLFGASTSAYQIEGDCCRDGKGFSIWDEFTHQDPSPIKDLTTGDEASASYLYYEKDVEAAYGLGLQFYKFSISWPRILPCGLPHQISAEGIAYYDNLIDSLLKHNITPVVTLYHYDLPNYLQTLGGWVNSNIVDWFTDYAKIVFERFSGKVHFWITINNPRAVCHDGYGSNSKAPGVNSSGFGEYNCNKNILLAHAKVYHMFDSTYRKDGKGYMGIAISFTWFEPASESNDDRLATVDAKQFNWGMYVHPIFTKAGGYPMEVKKAVSLKSSEQGFFRSRLPEFTPDEIKLIRGSSDFLGVEYFTTTLVYRDASVYGMYQVPSFMNDLGVVLQKDPTWSQAKSKWLHEVPWGLYKLLLEIKQEYGNPPVYITANGWSTEGGILDDDRIQYIRGHLTSVLDALTKGCNIEGYAVWSLIDGFEWTDGFQAKFGLYEVDLDSPELTRISRKSALIYKEIIKTKSLNMNFEPETTIEIIPDPKA